MPLRAAFWILVAVWSTTPLAIQWSGQGPGFILGLAIRLLIGCFVLVALLVAYRKPLPWTSAAIKVYLSASIGIFGSMSLAYWGAQQVASGLISVFFGLTPFFTALFARLLLDEPRLTARQYAGIALAVLGLLVIFLTPLKAQANTYAGLGALVLSTLLHAFSMTLTKRQHEHFHGLTVTAGGLLLSTPLAFAAWWILDSGGNPSFPAHAIAAIIYLGVIATGIGFSVYYYLLKHSTTHSMAIIPLITPPCALLLGALINQERLALGTWIGVSLVFAGLLVRKFD